MQGRGGFRKSKVWEGDSKFADRFKDLMSVSQS